MPCVCVCVCVFAAVAVSRMLSVNSYSLAEGKGLHLAADMVLHSNQHHSRWHEVLLVYMHPHLCSFFFFTPWSSYQPHSLQARLSQNLSVCVCVCMCVCVCVRAKNNSRRWFCCETGKLSGDIWVTRVSVSSGLWPEAARRSSLKPPEMRTVCPARLQPSHTVARLAAAPELHPPRGCHWQLRLICDWKQPPFIR